MSRLYGIGQDEREDVPELWWLRQYADGQMSDRTNKVFDAIDSYEWLAAYVDAGFTREEAMQILCRPWVTIKSAQTEWPPDLREFWERQNALATKMMVDMEEE